MVCVDDTCYLYDINASCIICTFVSYAKPVMGDQRSTKCIKTITCGTRAVQIGLLQRCLGPRINWTDCSQFSMQQHDSSSPPVDEITWHCCFGNYTGFLFQNAWSLKCVPYCIAASTDSALPTCPAIWNPCPTPVHDRDCVLLPLRLWWFLLHGDLRLATALSGCHWAGLECLAKRSLYSAIFVIIAAATKDRSFPPFLLFWLTSGTFLRDISVYFWLCSLVHGLAGLALTPR